LKGVQSLSFRLPSCVIEVDVRGSAEEKS
jgi:hypothetical protein